jgi:hypothetical protein
MGMPDKFEGVSFKRLFKNFGIWAHFWRGSAKNRAFRFNSSDLLMQILWDFRYNPLARLRGFQDIEQALRRRMLW